MLKTLAVCIAIKYFIVSVFGQSRIFCNNAFECVGTDWVLADYQWIYGEGYKSLYGAHTSITRVHINATIATSKTLCRGAFACAQISFINTPQYDDVHCDGSHSCANIDGLSYINGKLVYCHGLNSCEYSNIIASETVFCSGSQSCIYANINAPNVYANGAYSLYQSIIDSGLGMNNTLNINLKGYQSGFGATVICRAGDICNIKCYNNGCEMLFLHCEQNNCNILFEHCHDEQNYCNILHYPNKFTIPPITNMSEYNYTLYDIKYDSKILGVTNNDLCINNNGSNFVYDNYYENAQPIQINKSATVCCRGLFSCLNASSITTSGLLVCSGTYSCRYAIINAAKSVFCEGDSSCLDTVINNANDVYCLGNSACARTEIRGSTNVYCLGDCRGIIQSIGNDINVYFLGALSGHGINIYCDIGDQCYIQCGGSHSCGDYTILYCNNNCFVDCNEDTRCPVGDYTILSQPSSTAPITTQEPWTTTAEPTILPPSSPTALITHSSTKEPWTTTAEPTTSKSTKLTKRGTTPQNTINVYANQCIWSKPNALRSFIVYLFISLYSC